MATRLNPYLNFRDKTKEVMEFYKSVFGGELTMNTFKESGMGDSELIMHSQLTAGDIVIMSSDVPEEWPLVDGSTVSLSLSGEDEATLRGYWDKLSAGATIGQPLEKAPWGDTFGMLTDKFGVRWLVNIVGPKA